MKMRNWVAKNAKWHRAGKHQDKRKVVDTGPVEIESESPEDVLDDVFSKHPRAWEFEPDYYSFTHVGYICEVKRNEHTGALNGYVTVPDGHPAVDCTENYTLIDQNRPLLPHQEMFFNLEVHGGVTYKDGATTGFDCNHMNDYAPLSAGQYTHKKYEWDGVGYVPTYLDGLDRNKRAWDMREIYRTIGYVMRECKHLAEQLKKMEGM